MNSAAPKTIYSIGHSNNSLDAFMMTLLSFDIAVLADVRSFPGSKWLPHFNKPALQKALAAVGIKYMHFPELGGKRDKMEGGMPVSYTMHMQTAEFKEGIGELQQAASAQTVAYMCAEASWRNCHRQYISQYLKDEGWTVLHIAGIDKAEPHPEQAVRKPLQGDLFSGI